MQAIMLAAGKGSRLGKYTKNNTKCMLKVNGITLLERTIDALINANINKLILVLGYKSEGVKSFITKNKLDKKIEIIYVENEIYDKTNNIYSLFLARNYFEMDDTILLESDLIYDGRLIKNIVDSQDKNLVLASKYENWMDGTVITLDNNNNVLEFIEKKDFDFKNIDKYYKTVNIYKFSKEYIKNYYIPFLEAYIKSYGNNSYYELVLKVISRVSASFIKAMETNGLKWYEIDDSQDLDIASIMFKEGSEKLELYNKRFGGYWRFNGLKDYCYLVNPYFPTKNLIEKMKYSFSELLFSYPSTMNIQNNCISRFFDIDESMLLVGNGAAELINNLKSVIKGKVGVFIPTFNEYIRCFDKSQIIEIDTSKYNYKKTKELCLSIIDKVDNLVLINPDNPTGDFLDKDEVLEIIDEYSKKNKNIIFDESFIDFSSEDKRYTLINDDILKTYKNLIVIKSISKSYGVPGLRLGVMASGNKEYLKIIKESMPVWNINSFAEYFLQIFIPYKKEYISSCNEIVEQRKLFVEKLKDIKYLEVFDSEANYVMCKLKGIKSEYLAKFLLEKYNIFIKVLKNKNGFNNENYIRLAVKDGESNEYLIKALKEIK